MKGTLSSSETLKTEIDTLIEALHQTEQRLEELTGGQVDTVANRQGRTTLLRLAQIQLRESEAVKQAAILDALPAHIALLDTHGRIMSVNRAWQRFSGPHAIQGLAYGLGVNYVEACNGASGSEQSVDQQIARGVQSVLDGELKNFSIEYPFHASAERWFLLSVTPLNEDQAAGAVVMHVDVTAQRRTEKNLRTSESRFRQMAESIQEVFFLRDLDGAHMYYISPAYEKIWGRTCESVYADPASWAGSIHPDDLDRAYAQTGEGRNAAGFDLELRIIRPDGEVRWIHTRGYPILNDAGVAYRMAGVASDVTLRKHGEIKIEHLNRVYAVLSQISAVTVRVQGRKELFREACRIAVEAGAFDMAWIGVIDPITLEGSVAAWYGGKESYLEGISLTARADTPDSERPACRAVRLSQPVICNDVASDYSLGPLRDELLAHGHKSVGYFPLTMAGLPNVVLTLCSGESHSFDEEEMRLLLELTANLSFALDHVEKQDRLNYLAYYDELTGLANSSLFLERVAQHMRGAVNSGDKLALVLIDLQRFKNINSSFGRAAGDRLLRQVAQWLTLNFGDANLLARMGADHFGVVLTELKRKSGLTQRIEQSMDALLKHSFSLNDAKFHIACKVGVAVYPDDGSDADTLFKNAEAALVKAKVAGDRYLFYAQRMTASMVGRFTLETQLREAVEKQQFVLHYQPKVSLLSGKLTGAEALIRWNNPRAGLIAPGEFIPVLEETGLIHEVGRWALHKVIEDHLRWRAAGLPPLRIAANVSALQLRSRSFIDEIRAAIGTDSSAAAGLELEITESLIMADVEFSTASLKAIRATGVTIAIDDFGTGYSSLSYLSKLPVDTLKIDRAFVSDMEGHQGVLVVSTIINLAHSLNLKVVAEGVETAKQSELLRTLGCDEMQGYVFSKPVPREVFEQRFLISPPASVTHGPQ
jgi:diguanylate cyclase (GGDEF)-like protein/PAS domain S-box-containing protein